MRFALLLAVATIAAPLPAQDATPQGSDSDKESKAYKLPPMYEADAPLSLTLTAPFSKLKRDRSADTEWREARIAHVGDSGVVSVPVRVRTRGVWRKKECEIPPILLNFTKDSTKKTIFTRLDRERLTFPCRNNDSYEQYVAQEYQIYRVQRLLTPYTYKVRLVRMTYVDSEKNDTVATRWAFLSEQDDPFAERVGAKVFDAKGATSNDLEPYENAFFGVWQYFVGNSDFSIAGLHNAVLILKGTDYIPVARDYDWSGAVNARYAFPDPRLGTKTVTERVMRGYCAPPDQYEKVFALFKEKKDSIYALYSDAIATQIFKSNTVKNAIRYFDDFYKTIDDPRRAKRDIVERCLKTSD